MILKKSRIEKTRLFISKLLIHMKKLSFLYLYQKSYYAFRDRLPIEKKSVFVEYKQGRIPGGNIYAIIKTILEEHRFDDLTLYIPVPSKSLKQYARSIAYTGRTNVHVIPFGKREYYKRLATCEFLINDTTFYPSFIKRDGQKYLNTWHGTPLKNLGNKANTDFGLLGNVQLNFFAADYLLYPNRFTMEHLTEDYFLTNFGHSRRVLCGYPRNEIFLDTQAGLRLKSELGLLNKQVVVYMPTWRGTVNEIQNKAQNDLIRGYFKEWDSLLGQDMEVFVRLHPFCESGIDYRSYKHIHPFPDNIEAYEFINCADALVTDYSSVLFDFAVTGRKIVLFTYDLEEYTKDRGFYVPVSELPFAKALTIAELDRALKAPKDYDDSKFISTYCEFDRKGNTKALLSKFFYDEDSELLEISDIPDNGKRNIFIYAADMAKNGITTSLLNTLNRADRENSNFCLLYNMSELLERQEVLKELPQGVSYLGYYHARPACLRDTFIYFLWRRLKVISYSKARSTLLKIAGDDASRILGNVRYDSVIHFQGYNIEMLQMIQTLSCRKAVYVHNDMEQEMKVRGFGKRDVLFDAYTNYDSVCVVTPDLVPITKRIAESYPIFEGGHAPHIEICPNIIRNDHISEMGFKEITFDEQTALNFDQETIRTMINSDKVKFITVGRFSPEKGHKRLLEAFEKIHAEYPDTQLIFIGGRGELYEDLVDDIKRSSCPHDVIAIRYMTNPYSIIKKCDCFVLPSFYEGFGLVLAEADILGLPCFSTDIVGPELFMKAHGGRLVDNSMQGLIDGMRDFLLGKLPPKLDIDYDTYNKDAVEQFYRIAGL